MGKFKNFRGRGDTARPRPGGDNFKPPFKGGRFPVGGNGGKNGVKGGVLLRKVGQEKLSS